MKNQKGITLVALVITIIILIILAGISVSTLIGENGIITKAKEAKQNIMLAGEAEALQLNQLYYELEIGGELTEDEESAKKDEIIVLLQKQVEELQNQVGSLQTENEELKTQIADLNTQIGELQTELESLREQVGQKDTEIEDLKAQVSEKESKIQELQNQLNNINSLLTQTNATSAQILSGYTAYSGGQLITGTMVNRGAASSTLNCGASYTIPAGYHNGSGVVKANSLASQTSATATAADILSGKTAYVNGKKLTGTATSGTLVLATTSTYKGSKYENKSNAGYIQSGVQSFTLPAGLSTDKIIVKLDVINTQDASSYSKPKPIPVPVLSSYDASTGATQITCYEHYYSYGGDARSWPTYSIYYIK